ncbi:PDR/VanB family oxidoreductase [Pseudonocardia asaccharolytica]|uniref:Ferredoxin n=1 Tax=Pseudonocardia asaccharolytica DSM 44247 = NBRC 16224 TaxID=1123024 RepID=A0A511D673_9PSEU|nr:PDR/VanB family oxidoreductase [Pseudonocardia asaccharolytica]GEL20289.1 ferredoxin [Pseudonocardia asaccharolytica DSM 44247 = NBRC 16224]
MADEWHFGEGWTPMLVEQIRSESRNIVSVTLVDPDGQAVPAWEPGAHIELLLPSGRIRQYSLCGDDQDKTSLTVAVLHEPAGRGGSREVHTTALVGSQIGVRGPRNNFRLAQAHQHLLIAGGIGVTPIVAMARALERAGADWRLVYLGRSGEMAFMAELRDINPGRADIVETDRSGRPDLAASIAGLHSGTAVYCCGPASLLADATRLCELAPADLILRTERFAAASSPGPAAVAGDESIEVELARTGQTVTVAPDRSILESVRDVRPDVPSSCEEGYCGTCETRVLEGTPNHRDDVLGAAEREKGDTMMICVSRAHTPRLLLDL